MSANYAYDGGDEVLFAKLRAKYVRVAAGGGASDAPVDVPGARCAAAHDVADGGAVEREHVHAAAVDRLGRPRTAPRCDFQAAAPVLIHARGARGHRFPLPQGNKTTMRIQAIAVKRGARCSG